LPPSSGVPIGVVKTRPESCQRAYRSLIDRVAAVGKLVGCRASLSGGWDNGPQDRGSFGVRLFIYTPEGAEREFAADIASVTPTWEQ